MVCALLIVVTAFSRMYLGVHTPLDVGVSFGIGLVLVFALYPLFRDIDSHPNRLYLLFAVMAVLGAAYLPVSFTPLTLPAERVGGGVGGGVSL